jgi:hypothetical protein
MLNFFSSFKRSMGSRPYLTGFNGFLS